MQIHGNSGPAEPEFPEEIRERQGERERLFHYFSFGCDATSFSRPLPQIGSSGCSSHRPPPTVSRPTFFLSGLSATHLVWRPLHSVLTYPSLAIVLSLKRFLRLLRRLGDFVSSISRDISLESLYSGETDTLKQVPDSRLILPQFSSPVAMRSLAIS